MGRRKIEIQPITHDRNRSVTFLKRKNGLFKKAYELGVLCSVDVCVIVFGHNGKLHEYSSGDSSHILERRIKYTGDRDCRRPADFNGEKGLVGDDGEDEVDSAGEDHITVAAAKKATKPVAVPKTVQEPKDSDVQAPAQLLDAMLAQRLLEARRDYSDSHEYQGGGNHGGPLPPTAHPLNITNLSTPHAASSALLPQGISQHHQQLAHQYLVQQLQNINPNLNSLSTLASLSGSASGLNRNLGPSLTLQAHAEALAAQMVANGQASLQGIGLSSLTSAQSTGASFSGGGAGVPVATRSSNNLGYPNEFLALLTGAGMQNNANNANQYGSQSNSISNLNLGGSNVSAQSGGFDWPGVKPSPIPTTNSRTPSNETPRSGSSPQSGGQRNSPGTNSIPQTSVADWLDILTGGGTNNNGSNNNSAVSISHNSNGPVFPWDVPIPAPSLPTNSHQRPPSREGANKRSREDGDAHRGSPTGTARPPSHPRSGSRDSVNGSELSDASESGNGKRTRRV